LFAPSIVCWSRACKQLLQPARAGGAPARRQHRVRRVLGRGERLREAERERRMSARARVSAHNPCHAHAAAVAPLAPRLRPLRRVRRISVQR
jgi:hypothetical protein